MKEKQIIIPILLLAIFMANSAISTARTVINHVADTTYFVCPEPILCGRDGQAVMPHLDQDTKEWLTGYCNQQLKTNDPCK